MIENKKISLLCNLLQSIKLQNYPDQEARIHSISAQINRFIHSLPIFTDRFLSEKLLDNLLTTSSIPLLIKSEDIDSCTKNLVDCICNQTCQTFNHEDEELSQLVRDQHIPVADLLRKTMAEKLKRRIWKDKTSVNLERATNEILNYLEVYGFFNTYYLKELISYILSDNADQREASISGLEDLCYFFFGEYQSYNAFRILNSIYKLIECNKYRVDRADNFDSHLLCRVTSIPEELSESVFLQIGQEIAFMNNKEKTKRVNVFGKYIDGENINKINLDPILSNFSQIHMCIVNFDDGYFCIDTSSSEEKFYRSIVWKRIIPDHPIILQEGMIIRLGKFQSSQIFEIISINGNEIEINWNKGELFQKRPKKYSIDRELIIGREEIEKPHILLNNEGISRRHAKFVLIDGAICFNDLGSKNFTYFGLKRRNQIANQEFSAFERINHDDIFSINSFNFHFQLSR